MLEKYSKPRCGHCFMYTGNIRMCFVLVLSGSRWEYESVSEACRCIRVFTHIFYTVKRGPSQAIFMHNVWVRQAYRERSVGVGRLLFSSPATGFPPKSECRGSIADREEMTAVNHTSGSAIFWAEKREAPLALPSLCPIRAPTPPHSSRRALTLKPSTASSSGSTLWPRCSRERSHTTQMGIWSSSQYSFRGSRCFSHTPISPPGPDGRSVRSCFTNWVTLARCRLGRICRCGKVSRHCGHDTLVSAAPQQRARHAQQMLWPQSSIMGSTKYCRHTGQVVSCCRHSATLPEAIARARGGARAWARAPSSARSPTLLCSLRFFAPRRRGEASRTDRGRRLSSPDSRRARAQESRDGQAFPRAVVPH